MKIIQNMISVEAEETDTVTVEIEELLNSTTLNVRINGKTLIIVTRIKTSLRVHRI